MCGRSGVDVLTVGVWPFWLWPFWSVAILTCYRPSHCLRFWTISVGDLGRPSYLVLIIIEFVEGYPSKDSCLHVLRNVSQSEYSILAIHL